MACFLHAYTARSVPMPKYTCSNCPTPVRWDSKTGLCLKCYTASRKPAPSTVEDGISVTGDTAVLNKTTTENVRTLEDLIRVCEIDTETWNIVSYECKASQQYSVPRATRRWSGESWVRPDTTPVLSQMFHVSAKLKRKGVVENTVKLVAAQLLEDIRRETSNTIRPRWQPHKADYLFEFTPFDLHMGKYTWSEETVTNYDIDIATDLFNASIDFLLNRALRLSEGKLDRVLCVFGNDVSHIDTKQATKAPAPTWTWTGDMQRYIDESAPFTDEQWTYFVKSHRSILSSVPGITTSLRRSTWVSYSPHSMGTTRTSPSTTARGRESIIVTE